MPRIFPFSASDVRDHLRVVVPGKGRFVPSRSPLLTGEMHRIVPRVLNVKPFASPSGQGLKVQFINGLIKYNGEIALYDSTTSKMSGTPMFGLLLAEKLGIKQGDLSPEEYVTKALKLLEELGIERGGVRFNRLYYGLTEHKFDAGMLPTRKALAAEGERPRSGNPEAFDHVIGALCEPGVFYPTDVPSIIEATLRADEDALNQGWEAGPGLIARMLCGWSRLLEAKSHYDRETAPRALVNALLPTKRVALPLQAAFDSLELAKIALTGEDGTFDLKDFATCVAVHAFLVAPYTRENRLVSAIRMGEYLFHRHKPEVQAKFYSLMRPQLD